MEESRQGQTFTLEFLLHVESVFIFLSVREMYHKRTYTESQNGREWKRPSEII